MSRVNRAAERVKLNDTFGRLTLTECVVERGYGTIWNATCSCGKQRPITTSNLLAGTRSCGCLQRESIRRTGKLAKPIKHGLNKTPEQRIWIGIRQRCFNKKCNSYANYGGRGITMCERWSDLNTGLAAFYADMGPRPTPKHTVERRDNNGPYAPENCYWLPNNQQYKNKRPKKRSLYLTYDNRTQPLRDWALELRIPFVTLYARMRRNDTPEVILGFAKRKKPSKIKVGSRRWHEMQKKPKPNN